MVTALQTYETMWQKLRSDSRSFSVLNSLEERQSTTVESPHVASVLDSLDTDTLDWLFSSASQSTGHHTTSQHQTTGEPPAIVTSRSSASAMPARGAAGAAGSSTPQLLPSRCRSRCDDCRWFQCAMCPGHADHAGLISHTCADWPRCHPRAMTWRLWHVTDFDGHTEHGWQIVGGSDPTGISDESMEQAPPLQQNNGES